MLQFFQYVNLSNHTLFPLGFHQFKLLVYFDCKYHARRLVNRLFDWCVCPWSKMLSNLVICYLSEVASTILAIFSFLLLVHDLVNHLLLHCFHIWVKPWISVKVDIELLPSLVLDFRFISRSWLLCNICNRFLLFLPDFTLLFDYINEDELDEFKLQKIAMTYWIARDTASANLNGPVPLQCYASLMIQSASIHL